MVVRLIDVLKERRGSRTQEEFAQDLGIPQPTLSRILNGRQRVGIEMARRIKARYPELDVAGLLLEGGTRHHTHSAEEAAS